MKELSPVLGGRAGRPMIPLVPAPNSLVAIGLEVNTASAGGCAVDLAGNVIGERIVTGDFLDSDPATVLNLIGDVADDLIDELERRGSKFIGSHISIPGVIHSESQRVLLAPRLGWRDIQPKSYLSGHDRLLAQPMGIGNVLGFAALAEGFLRHEDGVAPTFLYIAGDNAVGAALVSGGDPFTSLYGWDGNIGHILVNSNGPPCACGARGCVDTYVSRKAIIKESGLPPSTKIEDIVRLGTERTNERLDIALDRAADAVGIALATSLNLVSLPTVVFGDNLALLLPLIQYRVENVLRDRLLTAPFQMPRLEPATTGPHAAMRGGALSTLQLALGDLQTWISPRVLSA